MATAVDRQLSRFKREAAQEAEEIFIGALEAGDRQGLGTARIKAPPQRERVAVRFGGGTRATSGEYDWFYELNPEEQKRIRQNWMVTDEGVSAGVGRRKAMSPDEVEDLGLPMGEWLALTRGIDAARAVQTGKEVSAKRYGGRDPVAYLKRARPEEEGTPVRSFTTRKGDRRDVDPSGRVQYFTDENGVVHPIRASYENKPAALPSSYLNAYGQKVERRATVDDDEPF